MGVKKWEGRWPVEEDWRERGWRRGFHLHINCSSQLHQVSPKTSFSITSFSKDCFFRLFTHLTSNMHHHGEEKRVGEKARASKIHNCSQSSSGLLESELKITVQLKMGFAASNNSAVRKSIIYTESSFANFRDVHMEAMMEFKERKAVRFSISHSQTKDAKPGYYYASPEFTVGGHRWYFLYYPRGQQSLGGRSISLYLHTHNPSNAAVAIYTCTLLDQSFKPVTREFGVVDFFDSTGHGWHEFTTLADVERICAGYDNLKIDCELAVYNAREPLLPRPSPHDKLLPSSSRVVKPLPAVPSLLDTLWENKDMSDVTFRVEGESIEAHRLVLAARSSVFKALLYGPMSEGISDHIEIPDIKASVFKAMLHHIYTDSLPNTILGTEKSGNNSLESNMAAQHLLEAADRYALDGLKMICEDILCKDITVNSVATTLVLAHLHNCHQLKDACLEFLKDPKSAYEVMLSDGFVHLMQICPEVLKELRAKKGQSN